jgi:hypothetical protein
VGDEKSETLVLYSSVVDLNSTTARRYVPAGTILCEITSGDGDGKYGPYEKTASDGRQTIGSTVQPFVTIVGHDVTFGDKAVEGFFADCFFDKDVIYDVNDISDVAAQLSTLKAAFPQSVFRS